MNKTNLILGIILIILLSTVSAQTLDICTGSTKVLYIVNDDCPVESAAYSAYLEQTLEDMGFEVDLVGNNFIDGVVFEDYAFMLIDDHYFENYNEIPVNDIPAVILNTYHMEEWNWVNYISSYTMSINPLVEKVNNHIVLNGISQYPTVYDNWVYNNGYNTYLPVYYLSRFAKAPGLETLTTTYTPSYLLDNLDTTLALAKPGTNLLNGDVSNVRSCWMGFSEKDYWTSSAEKMFEQCVAWVTLGGDIDNDGIRDDCDNCIYTYNPDQADFDNDGLGDVCDNCPYTYNPDQANNDGDEFGNVCDICPNDTGNDFDNDGYCYPVDCVDTDDTIHPGADETVCNGIDNDCDFTLDEDYVEVSCGTGECSGITSCEFGEIFCKDNNVDQAGSDCGGCCLCENNNDPQETYDANQDLDCAGNNLPAISTCDNVPDGNSMTYDTAIGFISECSAIRTCTQGSYDVTSECDINACGAECELDLDCGSYCEANVFYSAGTCESGCTCNYNFEDCDLSDGWYDTIERRWVENNQCTQKEQKQQEYKEYSCGLGGCSFVVTDVQWVDTGSIQNKVDGTICNDGLFCNVGETCQAGVCASGSIRDCTSNDIVSVNQCDYTPDDISTTRDTYAGFTSVCVEETDICTTSVEEITSVCDLTCGAECEVDNDCTAHCEADVYFYSGSCDLGGCTCNYDSEDCNLQDRWYDTTNYQWVNTDDCNEKEQLQQEYRDYTCGSQGCDYSITDNRWEDTSSTRYEQEGTICDDSLYCTVSDVCSDSGVCEGSARDCTGNNDQCNVGICNEEVDSCEAQPTNEGLSCDDNEWCNVGETCQQGSCTGTSPRDCSGNDIASVDQCDYSPDDILVTRDTYAGFTSECVESEDVCTTSIETVTSVCDMENCDAECELDGDCGSYCEADVYFYSGSCDLGGCTCKYDSEDCNLQDGWYDTTNYQWVNTDDCNEKEQLQQEYRDYTCGLSGCDYSVTDNQWVDTTSTRYKELGTVCNDHLWCTNGDTCQLGECVSGPTRDCTAYDDQCNLGVCNEDLNQCEAQPDNEGLSCNDGLFCNVGETCQQGSCTDALPRDCSGNDLASVDQCDYTPDGVSTTKDTYVGFTSACVEETDICTSSTKDITSVCDMENCNAECEANQDCGNYCEADVYFYSGSCDLGGCTCNYDSEDCDLSDGWYLTGNDKYREISECVLQHQDEKEYRDYSCGVEGCDFSVTDTQWFDIPGDQEYMEDGTSCDDSLFCTVEDSCLAGVCVGDARITEDGVSCTVDSCDEVNDVIINAPDNSYCDNGLWCDGLESCDAQLDCVVADIPDCTGLDDQCNDGFCNENTDSCEAGPVPDGTVCNDHQWCTDGDICEVGQCVSGPTRDCTVNDINLVNSCEYTPDGISVTRDTYEGFTSTCNEADNICTTSVEEITSECDLTCGAECESDGNCESYCDAASGLYYESTTCDLGGCTCNYGDGFDCSSNTKWYDTAIEIRFQWIPYGDCQERRQKQREYRVYTCDINGEEGCSYIVTDTKWVDLSLDNPVNIRNLEDGTSCDADGLYCTVGDSCQLGVCTPGDQPDCTTNDIDEINVCDNDPDGILTTKDYRPEFISECSELNEGYECTIGNYDIDHVCNIDTCGAECNDNNFENGDGCSSLCLLEICGDGITHQTLGEECDDGNLADEDGCSSQCVIEFCGDNVPQAGLGEQCDDGNNVNGDGCDSTCILETCGNGIPQSGEVCDDGNSDNTDACLNNCELANCGDTYTWLGHEECDDGNSVNTDSCLNTCELSTCGDSYTEIGVEECDDGNSDNTDSCLNTCELPVCGDSYTQVGVEDCDDGNTNNNDGCNSQCVLETCGDDIINNVNEICDDGINNGQPNYCNAECSGETTYCGDWLRQQPNDFGFTEECDDGFLNGELCHPNYDGSCTYCSGTCEEITLQGPHCGDGDTTDGEYCDDGIHNGEVSYCNSDCSDYTTYCGDYFTQIPNDFGFSEECDDGQGDNTDYCLDNCMDAVCGDNYIWSGHEECDDGNTESGDGCDSLCVEEYCGDGTINNINEICDEGILNGQPLHCDLECGGITPPVCGNEVLEAGEECDDANLNNNDGCNSLCVLEFCGDGIVQDGINEECEFNNQCNDQDYHTEDLCVECGCENNIICQDECQPAADDICVAEEIWECRNDFDSDPCYEFGLKFNCLDLDACHVYTLEEPVCVSCGTECCVYEGIEYRDYTCSEGECLFSVLPLIDADGDMKDDRCDDCIDLDNDGICDKDDTCPGVYNPTNVDTDGDGVGNACDNDRDNDGYDADLDCNDWDPKINPGAKEIQGDGKDNDCNPDTLDREAGLRSQDLILGTKILNEDTAIKDDELIVAVYVNNKGSKTAYDIKIKTTLLEEYITDYTTMPVLKGGSTSRVILYLPLDGRVMPDEYYLRTTMNVETVKKAKYSQVLLH